MLLMYKNGRVKKSNLDQDKVIKYAKFGLILLIHSYEMGMNSE